MTLYENIGDVGTAICPGVEALKVQKFKVFTSSTSAKKRRAAEVGEMILSMILSPVVTLIGIGFGWS